MWQEEDIEFTTTCQIPSRQQICQIDLFTLYLGEKVVAAICFNMQRS